MADFNTPNLCGANEALNNASSKIENLISEIDSKIDAAASEAAAAFESKLTEVKAGLDGLAIDLPEAPAVNFQSEITSLINDVDRTTAQGILSFNAKVAQLKQDFGDTLTEKGLDLNTLISDASTRLGKDVTAVSTTIDDVVTDISGAVTDAYSSVTNAVSGITSNISSGLGVSGVSGNITESISTTTTAVTTGNICDLVPNLEIPSSASGTGITTQEIEERGTGTSVTLTQSPKSIVSVQGKKSTQSFFTNIQYKQNGKVIVPSATGTYSEIKVTYIVSLIKEKPVAAKQADVPPEKEEASIVSANTSAKDTSFAGLISKFQKDVEGASTSKDVSKDFANIQSAISSIGSPEFKAQQEKDFTTWQTEYKKLKADPLNYKPITTPTGSIIKTTTPAAAITKEIKTDADGFTYTETKRVTSSDAGLSSRPKEKWIELVRTDLAKEVQSEIDTTKYQESYDFIEDFFDNAKSVTTVKEIIFPEPVWNISSVYIYENIMVHPRTRQVELDGWVEYQIYDVDNRGSDLIPNLWYKLKDNKMTFVNITGNSFDLFTTKRIFAIAVDYTVLDKIDPNYKG